MPSAKVSSTGNMSQLVRDTYQANGLIRSHGQPAMASSQTSLQKLPASSPQFLYQQLSNQQQQQQSMHFPPPPMQTQQQQQQQQALNNKAGEPQALGHQPQYNSMIVPPQHQQQQLSMMSMNSAATMMPTNHNVPNNGFSQAAQPTILMAPMGPGKTQHYNHQTNSQYLNTQISQQQQQQQLHPTYMTQQQMLATGQQHANNNNSNNSNGNNQQQVPMTTIMIPAATASQLQNVSLQIQQAAMQAAAPQLAGLPQTPQILVFMIPYTLNSNQLLPTNLQVPSMTPDPTSSLNSTLVRQSRSNSSMMSHHQQQSQQQQPAAAGPTQQSHSSNSNNNTLTSTASSHSRAVSSLSNAAPTATAATAATASNHRHQQQHGHHEAEKFYVKANFSYRATRNRQELSFQRGDILHVLDTLQNNDYGVQYWLATRVNAQSGEDAEKGLIPNKSKAEELAIEQRTMDLGEHPPPSSSSSSGRGGGANRGNGGGHETGGGSVLSASVSRVNFLRRRSAQRSKSLCKDNWDNVVFDIGAFRLPTYERVVFKHPGFCRPVVIFGPISDLAREKLLKDYPEKYSYPANISQTPNSNSSSSTSAPAPASGQPNHPKVIRLKGVLDVIDQGKHALLDITAQAVEKLNYVNLAPIVIFMKSESKSIIKEFRSRAAESLDPQARDEDTLRRDGKSSRKLLEQSQKLEKQWFHVFTAVLDLSTMGSEMWYRKLREIIESQQSANVWMGEKRSAEKHRQQQQQQQQMSASTAESIYSSSSRNSNHHANHQQQQQQHQHHQALQHSTSCLAASTATTANSNNHNATDHLTGAASAAALNEKFSECLNLTVGGGAKGTTTNDLLPVQDTGIYGNRSKLRNDYVHSLAQKLARASSEPKLNGLTNSDNERDADADDHHDEELRRDAMNQHHRHHHMSYSNHEYDDNDDDDDDDDDDDEIIKKPLFPNEYDNSSSVSSSNGMGSTGGGGGGGGAANPINFGQFSLGAASSTSGGQHLQAPSQPYQQQQPVNGAAYHQMPPLPPQHQVKPPAPLPPQAQAHAQALQAALEQTEQQQLNLQKLNQMAAASRSQLIGQESIYSMNGGGGGTLDSLAPMVKTYAGANRLMGAPSQQQQHNGDYYLLPPMDNSGANYGQQLRSLTTGSTNTNGSTASNPSTGGINGQVASQTANLPANGKSNGNSKQQQQQQQLNQTSIDLARVAEHGRAAGGGAYHIYSDMNQNNYLYYNVNKI